ncbi:MAG: 50S ribosomal protein L11 methyltransferase [Woeseiaceae bacterium]|nr:50S ribosomal protein L11 methyltransferase [Woeseiaceae bacterium]
MQLREFVINLGAIEADRVEEVLCRHGAWSVTLSAASDEAVIEPAPGTTPLWGDMRLSALFSEEADFSLLRADLRRTLAVDTLPENSVTPVADRAWEREWLKRFRPMRFGLRLWVAPEHFALDAGDAAVVRLDPGLAFGTGTHETTALCLEWLESAELDDRTLLDFGCGSGILAIAGLKLGAAAATAVDHDLQAITATRQNARRNQVDERLLTTMRFVELDDTFDIVVANILANTLVEHAESLCRRLKPGGRLALSGILVDQAADVRKAFEPYAEITEPVRRGEWVLLSGTGI